MNRYYKQNLPDTIYDNSFLDEMEYNNPIKKSNDLYQIEVDPSLNNLGYEYNFDPILLTESRYVSVNPDDDSNYIELDFSGIQTTNNRKYDKYYINYINTYLKNAGIKDTQRASIIANIIEESGGDCNAVSPDGKFKGLLLFERSRYNVDDNDDPYKSIDKLLYYIISTLNNTTDGKSWTHGGSGTGYSSFKDAINDFNSNDLATSVKGFTLGYVRPAGKNYSFENRLKVALQILPIIQKGKNGIKIKPSHKGQFTKYCNGKVTNECIERGKNSSNPKVRKQAVFAENARKWKHSLGGQLLYEYLNIN